MKTSRRGINGFTLIELLIVVAILGVLAAVVIPNVGRFIGRGEKEAGATELRNIQSAVIAMMTDNGIGLLPNPVTATATLNMDAFPDNTSAVVTTKIRDPNGNLYTSSDKNGYLLFSHDIIGGDGAATTTLVNYLASKTTKGTYTVDAQGMVTQVTTGY